MNIPVWIHSLIYSKKYAILRHILFWIFIYLDEFLSLIGITSPYEIYDLIALELLGDLIMVYFNIYFLLPRFLLKGKVVQYAIYSLATVLAIIMYNYFLYQLHLEEDFSVLEYVVSSIASNSALVAMAAVIRFFKLSRKADTQIQSLKESNLRTELAYLKNQVNPHFLFNTLNNMYIMSQKKMDTLPDSIMQLSDLLRYQLYECDVERIELKKELEALKNYILLEKIRRQDLNVEFKQTGEPHGVLVAPLIFIPFVENAFKYSVITSEDSSINIQFGINEKSIEFKCSNLIGDISDESNGGIGLKNAKRRLQLIYPEQHQLDIIKEDGWFMLT